MKIITNQENDLCKILCKIHNSEIGILFKNWKAGVNAVVCEQDLIYIS